MTTTPVVPDEGTDDPETAVDAIEESTPEPPTDEEINAAIEAEMQARFAAAQSQAPRRVTVQDLFGQMVALVGSATGKTFRNNTPTVSETAATKLMELSLMWALQTRNNPALGGAVLAGEEEGEVEEPLLPVNEFISGSPEPEES